MRSDSLRARERESHDLDGKPAGAGNYGILVCRTTVFCNQLRLALGVAVPSHTVVWLLCAVPAQQDQQAAIRWVSKNIAAFGNYLTKSAARGSEKKKS